MYKSSTAIALFSLSMFATLCFAGPERIYKWVDANGETHYGHTIPPEYSDRDRYEIDGSGRIMKKINILTGEERKDKQEAEVKRQEEKSVARDKSLRDKSLLNTYSNVKEIDLARARNLQQVDARAQVAEKRLSSAHDAYAVLKSRADNLTKAGKPIPAYLSDDLSAAQANTERLTKELAAVTAEKTALEGRYDDDKARYKELTGK